MKQDVTAVAGKYRDYVIALRRHFHTWPELSKQEFKTQERVIAELVRLGLAPQKKANTGVVADITGSRPGPTIAVRADMDALPIQDECGQPYQSREPGVCHACAHDGHTAMLLGVAGVLTELKAELSGTVRLLFQPSEERAPGGAAALIADGALEGVAAVIGAHLWQPLEVGKLGISFGQMMAQPGGFNLTIKGRGGHGSMPHETVDPILAGMQIGQAISAVTGNNIDCREPSVAVVTIFQAGAARNIIPDTAYLEGVIRVFDSRVMVKIQDRIEQIASGICAAHGAEFVYERYTSIPPVVNHPAVTRHIREAGIQALGEANVIEVQPSLAAEDFSVYQRTAPGALMFIGAGNAAKGIIHPHHHPRFDIDEDALSHGVEIMARTVLNYLSAPPHN